MGKEKRFNKTSINLIFKNIWLALIQLIFQCVQVKHKTTKRENTKNLTEKVHTAVKSFNFDLRDKCKQQQEVKYI